MKNTRRTRFHFDQLAAGKVFFAIENLWRDISMDASDEVVAIVREHRQVAIDTYRAALERCFAEPAE